MEEYVDIKGVINEETSERDVELVSLIEDGNSQINIFKKKKSLTSLKVKMSANLNNISELAT